MLLLLLGVAWEIRSTVTRELIDPLVDELSESLPLKSPPSGLSDRQYQELKDRLHAFDLRLQDNKPASELVLTSQDLNALINHDETLHNTLSVAFYGNSIHADVSIPVTTSQGDRRYFNAQLEFTVSLLDEQLEIHLLRLRVKGSELPDKIMHDLRLENLGAAVMKNEDTRRALSHLSSISVEAGRLVLQPRI